jgi:hypothetical protein
VTVKERARSALRPRGRSQGPGDPCEDCGTVLVVCMQCDAQARCLVCYPYDRPSVREQERATALRMVRDRPEIGLFVGVLGALVPAMLLWAGAVSIPPGVVRSVAGASGAVAVCASLAAGAALAKLPLPGEIPACRRYDWTPFDRRCWAGYVAFFVQLALVVVGFTAA